MATALEATELQLLRAHRDVEARPMAVELVEISTATSSTSNSDSLQSRATMAFANSIMKSRKKDATNLAKAGALGTIMGIYMTLSEITITSSMLPLGNLRISSLIRSNFEEPSP
ncbi:hypothetical protein NL676_001002 [Syzygium grande]|nr:hypothetical protein NL676_001002 [Syzygium grande]